MEAAQGVHGWIHRHVRLVDVEGNAGSLKLSSTEGPPELAPPVAVYLRFDQVDTCNRRVENPHETNTLSPAPKPSCSSKYPPKAISMESSVSPIIRRVSPEQPYQRPPHSDLDPRPDDRHHTVSDRFVP